MQNELKINSDIITWAINRAGFDLQEFVKTKFPKAEGWINETKNPTLKQLESFANKVHLPFGYLFLEKPPKELLPIPFFRTIKPKNNNVNINVYDTILLLQRRQEWLVEYLKENDFDKLEFVGKYNENSTVENIVNDIRVTLGLSLDWASAFSANDAALNHFTEHIEEAGIMVTFNSVVENNNHRKIPIEECRGFVLVDEVAPFLFINAADSKGAQMFTLSHELAHVWTGKSAGFDYRQFQPANDPIEILCDKVAAEFLVPAQLFLELWEEKPDFKFIARKFKVSPIVIGRRALDLGKISKKYFFKFYSEYMGELKNLRERKTTGGNFYATQKKKLGNRFTAHVNQAVKEGKLLYNDAYKLTGLKGNTYNNFINEYF